MIKKIYISTKEELRDLILKNEDLSKYDYSSITDMSCLLSNCSQITTIPELHTSNVTNMEEMFYRCERLKRIPLMDTSKVTNMNRMFSRCFDLEKIPLMDTSKVERAAGMFASCLKLKDIQAMDISSMEDMEYMFTNTKYIYSCIRQWGDHFRKVDVGVEGMFSGGEIMLESFGVEGSIIVLKSKCMINDFEIKAMGKNGIEEVLIKRLGELLMKDDPYFRIKGKKLIK